MKKYLLTAFAVITILLAAAHIEVRAGGYVLNTDIRVFIDGVRIMGYNIDGYTYIVAEDLNAHGFSVIWDGNTRSIGIARGESTAVPAAVPENLEPVGSVAFQYFHTDIVAFMDGIQVQSYNIDGRTVVRADDLARFFGRMTWNAARRELGVHTRSDGARPMLAPTPRPAPEPTPSPTPTPAPAEVNVSDFERRVFELTNAVRERHGLTPFLWHDSLSEVAHAHSRDMAENNFIEHTGSDGSSVAERIDRAGIVWRGLAENVAGGQRTPEEVVLAWMDSPGHRDNILNPIYTHLGVGFYHMEGTMFRFHWTQKFLAPR